MKEAAIVLLVAAINLFFRDVNSFYTSSRHQNNLLCQLPSYDVRNSFFSPSSTRSRHESSKNNIRSKILFTTASTVSEGVESNSSLGVVDSKDIDRVLARNRRSQLREEGGRFAFNTPYGALNPYAIFYGITAIFLGFFWYAAIQLCKLSYWLSGGRFDKKRHVAVFVNQCWGRALMKLTFSDPKFENLDILKNFYKSGRAAMIVANHNSWQDIIYLCSTVGWGNKKLVAKKELGKVPILGSAITVGGNVVIDRKNRGSQLRTIKDGIQWLKNGVHLCVFPEGTRSRNGKLMAFKTGAFSMAYKTGSPIIPISIVGSNKIQPSNWMFPMSRAKGNLKVVVHEPVELEGKDKEEVLHEVREAIISGLPDDQKP